MVGLSPWTELPVEPCVYRADVRGDVAHEVGREPLSLREARCDLLLDAWPPKPKRFDRVALFHRVNSANSTSGSVSALRRQVSFHWDQSISGKWASPSTRRWTNVTIIFVAIGRVIAKISEPPRMTGSSSVSYAR